MLKVVILGYGELAQALVLGTLQSHHKIVGVMRWKRNKKFSLKNFIKDIFIPEKLLSIIRANNIYEIKAVRANSKKFIREMQKLKPDVIIVGSWGEIIKKEISSIPKISFINCHPSLLPKHRGSNPYSSVIRQGETKTGVTFHILNEKIDAGDILLQAEIPVTELDNGESLKSKCAYKVKETVKILLNKLEQGDLIPQKQNEARSSYFPALSEEDAFINWNKPAETIQNQIRGLYPWLKCYTAYKKGFVFINSSKIVDLQKPVKKPGKVLEAKKNNLLVSTGDPYKAILCLDVEPYNFLYALKNSFKW